MITIIKWNKTEEVLPERRIVNSGNKEIKTYRRCLVVWENQIKFSRYLDDEERWEGYTKEQQPIYWSYADEVEFVE